MTVGERLPRARYAWHLIRLTRGRYAAVLWAMGLCRILGALCSHELEPLVTATWAPSLAALAARQPLNIYRVDARGLGTVRFDGWRRRAPAAPAVRPAFAWRPLAWRLALLGAWLALTQLGGDSPLQLAAFPVLLVDSATGSDSAASGAGPASAVTGTKGRTRNTASQTRVGFFEASAPDLSGVATDGSHALYIAIATAGQRNFSSISAKKDTEHTGSDAAITTGTAVLVVGSTTGWTAGDVIKVAGAGAAGVDLYSTILTVDSGIQATLNDNAGTTVAAAAWVNPKQVSLTTGQGFNTGTTDTSWAIGGVRAAIGSASSLKLINNNSGVGDAMGGWIIEMKSGHTESFSSIRWYRSGSTTDGPQALRGEANAATLPILTCTANAYMFDSATGKLFQNFEVRNSNGSKTASSFVAQFNQSATIGMNVVIDRVKATHSTNKMHKFLRGGTTGELKIGYVVIGCEIANMASDAIEGNMNTAEGYGLVLIENDIHDNGGAGYTFTKTYKTGALLLGNKFRSNTSGGINLSPSSTNREALQFILWNKVYSNGSHGVVIGTDGENPGAVIWGNTIYSNTGYGISSTPTVAELLNRGFVIDKNKFWGNSSGDTNPAGVNGLGNPGGLFTTLAAQSFLAPPGMGGGIHG